MDPDDMPSTSKGAKGTRVVPANKKARTETRYPVTFEEFKKFANVEEYVMKEMERAGPDICRINYKIRHKYYPVVYQQFYTSQAIRAKMLRNGLTLKPIPKFLKEKLMQMPGEEAEPSTSTRKHRDSSSKHEPKNQEILYISSATKLSVDKNNKKANHLEKDNSTETNLKPESTKYKSSAKFTPKIDKIKGKPLVAESRKITNFFTALALAHKSPELNQDTRKRKYDICTEKIEAEPQIKRLKDSGSTHHLESTSKSRNTIHKVNRNLPGHLIKAKPKAKENQPQNMCKIATDLLSDVSDAESNIQIMVEVTVPPAAENKNICRKPEANSSSNKRKERKTDENKRLCKENQHKRRCQRRFHDEISDDSDIESSVEMVDLCKSTTEKVDKLNNTQSPVKSPLPRRNRIEDFKKPTISPRQNERKEGKRQSSSDTEMALLSISGLSTGKVKGRTTNEIHEWLAKGLKALTDESDDEQNTTEHFTEECILVDRLTAINTYPEEFKKYIKYLLNLEIQKGKGTSFKPAISQGSSRSKVVSAFLQMSFDDYKNLINAEKLLSQKMSVGESVDTITVNLKKQYESFIRKERPWPMGVHIKLSALRKYLVLKGLPEPIQLKHIPPRILCFEEVLEYTNLKECTSLSREKPPDSYKYLLDLCKKEYLKCCADGVWIEGMKFTDIQDGLEESDVTLENTLSESISMPPLRVVSSDFRNQSLNKAEVDCNANNKRVLDHESREVVSIEVTINSSVESHENINRNLKCRQQKTTSSKGQVSKVDEIEKLLDKIFDEPEENNIATNVNDAMHPPTDHVPTDYNELKRTLSGDIEKPSIEICHTTEAVNVASKSVLPCSLEGSEGIIIDDSPDSAGQLLNNIIQPAVPCTPPKLCKKLPEPINAVSIGGTLKASEIAGRIPPSPNLFQSSGESDPKSTQSQLNKARTPETVFVPCKHSMTFHTEENNLTALIFDQTSDIPDPFADASANQEDTMVEGITATALDPNVVVKQEHLSVHDNGGEGCYLGLDDSIEIIEVPPSEPIVIQDEETAPDLLEMLLSRSTKSSYPEPAILNLTPLPSSSCLENFQQAQQLPSNLSFSNPNLSSISSTEKDKERAVDEATDSNHRSYSIEVESPCETTYNLFLKTERQKSNFTKNDERAPHRMSKNERVGNQSCDNSVVLNLAARSEKKSQQSKETPLSGSTAEVSYVSIAPQNIPSEIDLTQSSSNKFSIQPMQSKDRKKGETSTYVVEKAKMSDQHAYRDEQGNDENGSVESEVSVYVIMEGYISEVKSSSNDVQYAGTTQNFERILEESSTEIENDENSKEDESSSCAAKTVGAPANVKSSEGASKAMQMEDVECTVKDSSKTTPHAEIAKGNSQSVELLAYKSDKRDLKSSTNIQDASASDVAISQDVTSDLKLLERTSEQEYPESGKNAQDDSASAENIDDVLSKDGTSDVELLECTIEEEDSESSKNAQEPSASLKTVDAAIYKDVTSDVKLLERTSEQEHPESSQNIQNVSASAETIDDVISKDGTLDVELLECTIEQEDSESSKNAQEPSASLKTVDAAIYKDVTSDVKLLKRTSEQEHPESSKNIQDVSASVENLNSVISKDSTSDVELLECTSEEEDSESSKNAQEPSASLKTVDAAISKDVTSDVKLLKRTSEQEHPETFKSNQYANASANAVDAAISKVHTQDVELLEYAYEEDDLESSTNIEVSRDTLKNIQLSVNTQRAELSRVALNADSSEESVQFLTEGAKDSTIDCQESMASEESHISVEDSIRVDPSKMSPVKDLFNSISQTHLPTCNSKELVEASEEVCLESPENILKFEATQQAYASASTPKSVKLSEGKHENLDDPMNIPLKNSTNLEKDKDKEVANYSKDRSSGNNAIQSPVGELLERTDIITETNEPKEREDMSSSNDEIQGPIGEVFQECIEIIMETREPKQRNLTPIDENPENPEINLTDLVENIKEVGHEHTSTKQQSESVFMSPGIRDTAILKQTADSNEVVSRTNQQCELCKEMALTEQTTDGPEVSLDTAGQLVTNTRSSFVHDGQPFTLHNRKICNIPALLSIAAVSDVYNEIIETPVIVDAIDDRNDNEDLIEVPLLIERRFIKSLPFSLLNAKEMQQTNGESTIYAIKANLEFNLEELCLSTNMCPERVQVFKEQPTIAHQEARLGSTIHRCQFDERVIRDWLGNEAIPPTTNIPEVTSSNIQPIEHGTIDGNAQPTNSPAISLRNRKASQKIGKLGVNIEAPSTVIDDNMYSNSPIPPHTKKTSEMQSKTTAVVTAYTAPEGAPSSITYAEPGMSDENAEYISCRTMCLRKRQTQKNEELRVDTDAPLAVTDGNCSIGVQLRTKPPPKTKKKKPTPKKSSKKHSEPDFVPQKTHAFRSLPLGSSKKLTPSETKSTGQPLSTVEEIDYLIEDASQVIPSSTASQILGTDCTYFEGSQLLRNIDNYCAPQEPTKDQKQASPEPQVNTYKRITMSEGITARKVWQVNLQWKTTQKFQIEVRFTADKRSLTVCDKSAKLLFGFSPGTWSDVLRVLREIDHFEYRLIASKNYRAVTPLHNVLRYLFDSAPQIANVRLINDSFSPYTTCEKVSSVYRKPFQCLTKTIPANILSRMKALKENLRNNNSEG